MSSHRATSSAGSGDTPALPPAIAGQSHYQLLELSPQASASELRQAFRNLSKRYHPDTTTLPPAEAREAFTRLRQAYAVLADPDSRRAYDAALQRPTPPAVLVPPLPTGTAAAARPIGVRRSLSGGEWFALVLLGLALALSLVLGVGLAWVRGAALVTRPSWWSDAAAVSATTLNPANLAPENVAPGNVAPGNVGSVNPDPVNPGPGREDSRISGPDSTAPAARSSDRLAPEHSGAGRIDPQTLAPGRGGVAIGELDPRESGRASRDAAAAALISSPVIAMRGPLPHDDPAQRGGIRQAP